ncbi:MAG: plasmid pRiA4b ORF-3 family protein [Chloroflexi bacterium]|nr:plasmid pRiA4b ORF-3 family protein [Chloroflexota bacterium]
MPLAEMEAHMAAFWDEVEAEAAEEADRNVQTATLEDVRLDVGQTFMYLFDYGDEWRFKVRVHAVNPDAPEGEYPRLVESVGKTPSQYPDWE